MVSTTTLAPYLAREEEQRERVEGGKRHAGGRAKEKRRGSSREE
jgi:hypothetical protein